MVIAETYGGRFTAFDIDAGGDLSRRRVWAMLPDGVYPDGICIDAESAIWVASPTTAECLRVREGGEVLERLPMGRSAFACALGGSDLTTLYVCTADSHDPVRQRRERNGRIEAFSVRCPGVPTP